MQFPLILVGGAWIVFAGPDPAATARELTRWREGQARTDGPPMFEPAPLLLTAPASADDAEVQLEQVVLPALADGSTVVLDAAARWDASHRPDLLLVWPGADGRHDPALHDLAREQPDVVLLRPGNTAELSLQVFDAMARRGLFGWGVRR